MSVRRSAFPLPALLAPTLAAPMPATARARDSLLRTRLEARALALRSSPGRLGARARGEVMTALKACRTATEELHLLTTSVLEPAVGGGPEA